MNTKAIIQAQQEFFRKHKAGCGFAALAAKDPARYGWVQKIVEADYTVIELEIRKAIADASVTTLSLILPDVTTEQDLVRLVDELQLCPSVILEQKIFFEDTLCLGFRVKVGNNLSWISGFGNFEFFPPTRRTPFTEIAFRVKPRPDYEWVMKKTPVGVIHLADLDMLGLPKLIFEKLWNTSLKNTARIIGHKPDLKSAAKTTFALPQVLISCLPQNHK